MSIISNFVKTYTDKKYQYTATVTHKGTVVALAMDEERRIYYSVLNLEDTQKQEKTPLDVNYWIDNPQELPFPNEIVQVGYAILPNEKMPMVKKGTRDEAEPGTLRPEEIDPFLSTTARLTADANFQVLSDGKYIYLFRQAIDKTHQYMLFKRNKAGDFVLDANQQKVPLVNETLLLDRYVLAGTDLKLKMEVRYQRSRHKYEPQTPKDGLGAKDLEKKPFLEPTQELDFVQNLKDGRFNVLLLPTQVSNLERWQVFSHNSKTDRIDSFNIERSKDGLFNTKGTQLYTSPDPQYQNSVLERQPGVDSFTGEPLIPLISKSGYAESALELDGVDDYVELPPESIPVGNEITISFWAYGGSKLPSYNSVLEALDAKGTRVINLHFPWSNSNIYFDCGNSGGGYDRIAKGAQASDYKGTWSHWAFTKNATTGEMKIYLNGQLWHSATGKTKPLPQTDRVRLGSYAKGGKYYNGTLEELRIWNRARTQTEIQAEMNHRLVGNEPGLWSYWRFDEGQGDRLFDQTDNGHHATLNGGTWVKSDAPIGDHPGIRRTSFSLQSVADNFALQFDGKDDRAIIQLGSPWQAPQEFTVEMWVKPDPTNQVSYTGLFSNNYAPGSHSGSSFQIDFNGQGNYRFLHDKGSWLIGKAIADWQHLAVSYDGNLLTMYLNGQKGDSFTVGNIPTEFRYYILGANRGVSEFLQGQLEEVRVWKRAISEAEIKRNIHSRLTGKENGLMAYFPCTQGSGILLQDQTANAHHAAIKGATWVNSTSPISSLTGASGQRTIASGLSALLYHQQEKATTGYDQQEKPVKRNARVMLAVATGTQTAAATDHKYIAALDFGVSREGKLTQVPDRLMLPNLQASNSANQDLDAVSRLQEEIATLTASINQLEIDIAALKGSTQKISTLEAQKNKLEGEIQNLTTDLNNKKQDLFNYFCRLESANYAGWYLATDTNGNLGVTNSGSWNNLWAFGNGYLGPSLGYSQSKSIYPKTPSGRYLSNNGNGSLSLDTSPYSVFESWFPVQSGSLYKLKSVGSFKSGSYSDRYTYYLFGMKGVAGLTEDGNNALCNWKIIKTDQALPVITNAENNLNNKKAALQKVVDELNDLYTKRDQLKDKEGQLALQKIQLDNKETELELMRSGIQGEVALPMSLLHTDPFGLTVSGGLLNFAYTKDTPLLVNSATGKLALYFRGVEDQFFVTYYDTNTTKAQYFLEADKGKLIAIARSAEPECDRAQFTITNGSLPNTCTLVIENRATGLKETWQNVPREVKQFANVLNGGASQPVFIGILKQGAVGNLNKLVLSQKVKQSLTQGAVLSVAGTKVTVSQDISGTADTIPITPATLNALPDTPVYLIPYDYAAWTSSSRTSNPLENGSLQFLFQPSASTGNIKNGTVTDGEVTLSCQWVAESPGRALAFDGKEDLVALGDLNNLPQLDANGDLTLEAWVRPAQLADTARVIHHHSAQSKYTLGVKSKSASFMSALQLDGVNDYVELPPDSIPTGNELTISFWAYGGSKQPTSNSLIEALDANGQRVVNIHLPWSNSNIYLDCGNSGGSYDRIEKTAQASDFKGAWNHWAFTKNAATGEMKIYLNGKLWHSGTGKTKALPKTARVRLGSYAKGGNYYHGNIDEVQIWNKARSESDIQGDMNERLEGNEAGLVAYWRFEGGVAKDYSQNGYNGTISGQPAVVASALQENQIYSFAGVDNLFYQAKELAPMGQWHHLAAVYNQSYALQFNGNGSLECDQNPTLDLDRDLTIEAFIKVDNFNQRRGILTKGKLDDGTDENVPYSLYVDTDGKVAFAFEDKDGNNHIYKSSQILTAGQFYKIAVSRAYQTETKNQGTQDQPNVTVNQWADIRFYVNQKAAGYSIYLGADPDRNRQKLDIGKTYNASQENYFKGAISEIRLWNNAVEPENLGNKINGNEEGLIAWWRFEENEGNIAYDSKSENHAIIIAAQWIKNPDPQGSSLTLYQNGIPVPTKVMSTKPQWGVQQFTLGGVAESGGSPLPLDGLQVFLTGDSYKVGEQWDDLSGQGNHAMKASGCNMPTSYSVSNYSGKKFKVMRFNSSCGMILPDTLNLQKPYTIIIVDRYYGNTKGRTLQSRDNNWLLGKWRGNNGCFMEGWVGRYPSTVGTFTISTATLEGSSPNWYVDGVSKGNSGGTTAPGRLGLCKGGKAAEVSDADIAAILIWDRVLSDAERQKVEKWLGEQYGIPVGHNVTIGGCLEPFAGTMEEVRIWKVARTQEQIQDNLFTRIKGEKQDLIANYTFDKESYTALLDNSLIGNHLTLGLGNAQPMSVLSTAPISNDTAIVRSALAGVKTQFHDTIHCRPGIQEYSDLQYDIDGNLIGIQKRCYAYVKNGQWHLLTGYKVGNLITEWIGQVQADPQIVGYIEGAPPVPSENLTGTSMALGPGVDHYNASAIELEEAETVNYIYASSWENGFDMSMEMLLGLGLSQSSEAGMGISTEVTDIMSVAGLKTTFDSSQGSVNEASVSQGYNTTKTTRLDAWGAWEHIGSEINSYVGRRYVPANVGLALVQSDTMDVFALRLAHNNALVSYRFLPNPDIPKDWNIITFPLNPTYTKQGTLDGKVGLKEDGSVQPDPHYPNAATYGQWSYFKPIEAYSMKKRIERERQELATYYNQYSTFQNIANQASGDIDYLSPTQMATRNLANTYVWTADGGFFSESTDVMEATSETTTGFYSFQGMAGASLDMQLKVFGVAMKFDMDALFGGHLETTKTKGKETEKSFTLNVEVEGERDIQLYALTDALKAKYNGQYNPGEFGVYDQNGNPVKQPGKVDAYRFMTFYLEPTTGNFEDFFGKVVDPIWLEQSSEPNAIALRQANQGEKKPSCWRVFHRVTFVSRILPEIEAQNAPPLEKAIRAANIESNWELIKKIEPFVQTKTQDYVTFADAVRNAIATYLPELQGHEQAIIQYMALYFGLDEVI